jgi:hypothetical protein
MNKLFRKIGQIREYPWIKPSSDSVIALNQYAMFIGCQKFIIKKNFPLFVEHLLVAMGHKDLVRTSPTRIHNGKFFE